MTELDADNQGYKKVARTIDQALGDLARYLNGIPYTVTIDGLATRRLWGGLHNNKQGQPANPAPHGYPATPCPSASSPSRSSGSTKTPTKSRGLSGSRALARTTK